jgi:PKD repeat protein
MRWDWDDDGAFEVNWSPAMTVSHTFTTAGTYTVRLEVRDSGGLTATTARSVVVQPVSTNTPPTAAFTVTPPSGDTTTLFAFDASGSTDAEDGTPPEVRWDWDDDGVFEVNWGTAKTASHTFTTAGAYTVRLEVRDSGGLTATTARSVPVSQQAPQHRAYLPLLARNTP